MAPSCQSAQCLYCFTFIKHTKCKSPTQHKATSSQTCVVRKCQLFTQVITKAMILCKYSRCRCVCPSIDGVYIQTNLWRDAMVPVACRGKVEEMSSGQIMSEIIVPLFPGPKRRHNRSWPIVKVLTTWLTVAIFGSR